MANKINTPQNTLFNQANEIKYAIDQALININTILLCEIEVINTDGSCDIRSLVNVIDNSGSPIKPSLIFNIPKLEIRGGIAGVIVEPIIGDKVIVGFCQRDISAIKSHLTRQNPASYRRLSLMDGIILGVISNTPPSVYVQITKDGIAINANDQPITVQTTGDATVTAMNSTIEATTVATIKAPNIVLDGIVNTTANMIVASTLSINNVDFATHVHGNVTNGVNNTGVAQ